jgi:hypothetical protein
MGKIIQYRCPGCQRLLFKWETGSKDCLYKDPQVILISRVDNEKMKDVICSKCKTRSEICRDGLRKIEISSDTAELPALAKHIEIPA